MKKLLAIISLFMLMVPAMVFAGGSTPNCATKYPIVLSHGMGAQANNLGIGYWYNRLVAKLLFFQHIIIPYSA